MRIPTRKIKKDKPPSGENIIKRLTRALISHAKIIKRLTRALTGHATKKR